MSLSNVNMRNDYTGNGIADSFPYDFRIFQATDIEVWTNIGTGGETLLAIFTDYTVSGVGDDGGGSITLTAGALANGTNISILRIIRDPATESTGLDLTQPTSIRNQGPYNPAVIEDSFDRRTMMEQSLEDGVRRSLQLPRSEAGTKLLTTLPLLDDRAGKVLGFDSNGVPVAYSNVPLSPAITVTTFYQNLLQTTPVSFLATFLTSMTQNAALTALGISNFFNSLIQTTPAAFMQSFLTASTAAAARTALAFGTGAKFIVNGDYADTSVTDSKLSGVWQTVMIGLQMFRNTDNSKLDVSWGALGINEKLTNSITISAADPTVPFDITGTGTSGFENGGSIGASPTWASVYAVCGNNLSTHPPLILFSASMNDSPVLPTGWGKARRLGYVYWDGTDFGDFFQSDRLFSWRIDPAYTLQGLANTQGVGVNFATKSFTTDSTPPVALKVYSTVAGQSSTDPNLGVLTRWQFRPYGSALSNAITPIIAIGKGSSYAPQAGGACFSLRQDSSRQFQVRVVSSDNNGATIDLQVYGFEVPLS